MLINPNSRGFYETDSLLRVALTTPNMGSSYNHLMGIHSRKRLPMVVELLRPVWCSFFQKWCWEWNAITDHNVRGVPGVFMTYNWLWFERCLHNPWTIQLVYHHGWAARVKAKMLPNFIPRCSMYGLFTYIWVVLGVNVGEYTSPKTSIWDTNYIEL